MALLKGRQRLKRYLLIIEQLLQILGLLLHAKTFYLLVAELERKVYHCGGVKIM